MFALGFWDLWLKRIGWFLGNFWTRYTLAWLGAGFTISFFTYLAWTYFDDPDHPCGNTGHTIIDFGGQWIVGRMLVEGEGIYLYERTHMRHVFEKFYPKDESNYIMRN